MKKLSASKKMLVTAVFMVAATLLSKVLGLARDSLLTAFFGAGMESDAFLTASTIPTTLFDVVIGGVISATFIPVFNDIMSKKGKDEAMGFVNKFVTLITCITILISLLGILLRNQLVGFMASGYDPAKQALAANLTAIMFPMIIFTGLAFSFVGLLQSFGEYNIPSVISLVSNVAIIVYYFTLGKRFGIYGLAVTMIVAWSLQFLIEVPWIKKFGVRYRPDFRFNDSSIVQAIKLAGPMLVATWVQPLYTIVNQKIASGIPGAITYIQQSSRLYLIITGVVSFVVTNLIFPKLAKAIADKREEDAGRLFAVSLRSMFLLVLPLMAGFMILSEPFANLIYGHGKMTGEGVEAISLLLKFYSIGMIGLAVNEVFSKTFFSMQDSKTPMITSVISMLVNVVLAFILFNVMSTNGLALATAIGSVTNAVLNGIILKKKYPDMLKNIGVGEIAKTLVGAVVMAVVTYGMYIIVAPYFYGLMGSVIIALICGGAGILAYGIMLLILKEKDIIQIIKRGDKT